MRIKRILLILLPFIMLIGCEDKPITPPQPIVVPPPQPIYYDFIKNANFNEPVDLTLHNIANIYGINDTLVGEWKFAGGWGAGEIFWSENEGVNGSPCIGIRSTSGDTDMVVAQVIEGLDPNKLYQISAKVKIRNNNKGFGATLCSGTGYCVRSDIGITGSTSWQNITLDIDEAPGGKALICLRLGYSGRSSDGIAYFDDITISDQSNMSVIESEHLKFILPKNVIKIPHATILEWAQNLDTLYHAYRDLFSERVPFKGRKMRVRGMKDFSAWAWAGYPIHWNSDYIAAELNLMANEGHWSFGIMHEMGHNFDSTVQSMSKGNIMWNFNEELFANFRMYLAILKVPKVTIVDNDRTYVGTQIANKYKDVYDKSFGAGMIGGGGDGIHYTFIRIVDKYGWELFRDAFNYLYDLSPSEGLGQGNWPKFNFFLNTLDRFLPDGEKVRSTYSERDLQLIEQELTKV